MIGGELGGENIEKKSCREQLSRFSLTVIDVGMGSGGYEGVGQQVVERPCVLLGEDAMLQQGSNHKAWKGLSSDRRGHQEHGGR